MTDLIFENVDPIKIPLIKRFYKIHYPATKVKSNDHIISATKTGALVAVVRFKPVGDDFLLTGMAVDRTLRHQGIGSRLLKHCQENSLTRNHYCFSLGHLEPFYSRFGFIPVSKQALPNDLKVLFERYTKNGKVLVPMNYLSN